MAHPDQSTNRPTNQPMRGGEKVKTENIQIILAGTKVLKSTRADSKVFEQLFMQALNEEGPPCEDLGEMIIPFMNEDSSLKNPKPMENLQQIIEGVRPERVEENRATDLQPTKSGKNTTYERKQTLNQIESLSEDHAKEALAEDNVKAINPQEDTLYIPFYVGLANVLSYDKNMNTTNAEETLAVENVNDLSVTRPQDYGVTNVKATINTNQHSSEQRESISVNDLLEPQTQKDESEQKFIPIARDLKVRVASKENTIEYLEADKEVLTSPMENNKNLTTFTNHIRDKISVVHNVGASIKENTLERQQELAPVHQKTVQDAPRPSESTIVPEFKERITTIKDTPVASKEVIANEMTQEAEQTLREVKVNVKPKENQTDLSNIPRNSEDGQEGGQAQLSSERSSSLVKEYAHVENHDLLNLASHDLLDYDIKEDFSQKEQEESLPYDKAMGPISSPKQVPLIADSHHVRVSPQVSNEDIVKTDRSKIEIDLSDKKSKDTSLEAHKVAQASGADPFVKELKNTFNEFTMKPLEDQYSNENLQKLNDSIIDLIETTSDGDTSVMKVKLYPEDLGSVQVILQLEEGRVMAKIIVDNESVKQLFQSKLQELNHNLNKQNIQLDEVHIDVNDQGSNSHDRDSNPHQHKNHYVKRKYNLSTGSTDLSHLESKPLGSKEISILA